MAYGLSNGHVTDDVTWPQRCSQAVRSSILATAWRFDWSTITNPPMWQTDVRSY